MGGVLSVQVGYRLERAGFHCPVLRQTTPDSFSEDEKEPLYDG